MAYKTTFYQRQRGRNQQAPTDEPCLNCGAKPAENCHVIDWLFMRQYGFPPRVINQEWNLMPLCRPCHWLYDDRADIWIGYRMKQKGITNRKNEILTEFMSCLSSMNIEARLLSGNDLEEIRTSYPFGDMEHFGGIEDINISWCDYDADKTYLVTKIGVLGLNECFLEEEEIKKIEQIWKTCLKRFGVLTGKEYQHYKREMEAEYRKQQEMLMKLVAPRHDEAMKQAEILAKQHLVSVTLQSGEPWDKKGAEIRGEISAFDVTGIKDGVVVVKIWCEEATGDGEF